MLANDKYLRPEDWLPKYEEYRKEIYDNLEEVWRDELVPRIHPMDVVSKI